MVTIDLRSTVKEYIKTADIKLLKMIKALAESYQETELSERISVEQYNRELEASEKEIELGHFYTHEQVKERASQWGRK
jgi:predicted transcriptional regulator